MEVLRDHRATERATPSIVGGMKTAARFAVLGAVLAIGGDDREPDAPAPAAARAEERLVTDECCDANDIAPGTSLIGRRVRVPHVEHGDVTLETSVRGGDLRLTVNGKSYAIQKTMGIDVGRTIAAVEMLDGEIRIESTDHGEAIVERWQVENVLRLLARAESDEVIAHVHARFTPKEGSPAAGFLAVSRLWNGWKQGDPELFPVGFLRDPADRALASR